MKGILNGIYENNWVILKQKLQYQFIPVAVQ